MQIINTYRCNFTCDHCLFSCSPKRRGYMSSHILEKALAQYGDGFVNYCGGETFLHPEWHEQLRIIARQCEYVRIVTNGTKLFTPTGGYSKVLREFMEDFIPYAFNMNCSVTIIISEDDFHDYEAERLGIDTSNYPELLEYAIDDFCVYDMLTIEKDNRRKIINQIYPLGRALETGCYDYEGSCIIEPDHPEFTIDPDGDIFGGCNACAYLGNIMETSEDVVRDKFSKLEPQKHCSYCKYLQGEYAKPTRRKK